MDIDGLVAAAKEIDRKAELQEARTKRMLWLSREARSVVVGSIEHRRIIDEHRTMCTTVVDFGDAIADLREALHRKPKRNPK